MLMLGGGVFVTQNNKVLPGAYINVVNATKATSTLGDRGVVALGLPLNAERVGEVIECTSVEFAMTPNDVLGENVPETSLIVLREIFKHATKVYIYNTYVDEDDEEATAPTVQQICNALEPYDFNIICAYTSVELEKSAYISAVKAWRDNIGKKCQVVVFNANNPNYEGVINVVSGVSNEQVPTHALVAWVSGAEAGCAINASCTNMLYDGEYKIVTDKTQSQLEDCIENGQIAFHMVYGQVRLLEDVNSLTETTADKGEDFKSNQTIRVADQVANDIAKLFNTKYLGKIPNNKSGRVALWADIVNHHRQLETIQAIEDFDANQVTVEQGQKKKAVVVNDVIKVVNSMAQLYMTLIIE